MSIDVAVTDTETSDYVTLGVGGYSYAKQRVRIDYATAMKANWAKVRQHMAELAEDNPDIEDWIIETTQGGDLVIEQLLPAIPTRHRKMHNCGKAPLACPPGTGIHQRKPWEGKRLRARRQADYYHYGWVNHCGYTASLEEQQIRFPDVVNDDLVDENGQLCDFYLAKKPKPGEKVA
jgi:phage terminase large subunit-like protein